MTPLDAAQVRLIVSLVLAGVFCTPLLFSGLGCLQQFQNSGFFGAGLKQHIGLFYRFCMGLSHVFSCSPVRSSGLFSFSWNKTARCGTIQDLLGKSCKTKASIDALRSRGLDRHCPCLLGGCLASPLEFQLGDVSLVTPFVWWRTEGRSLQVKGQDLIA